MSAAANRKAAARSSVASAKRLIKAEHVQILAHRPVSFSAELRQSDRRELDDAVLEMIGATDAGKRSQLLDELYLETAKHYRQVRVVEIQKQVRRAGGKQRRLSAMDIAASIWDSLDEQDYGPRLLEWLGTDGVRLEPVDIPEGKPRALGAEDLFNPTGVDFRQGNADVHRTYSGVQQAALIVALANAGIHGTVEVPIDETDCHDWRARIESRISIARSRMEELAASRTGSDALKAQASDLLVRWLIHGRDSTNQRSSAST